MGNPLQKYGEAVQSRMQRAFARMTSRPRPPFERVWPMVREVSAVMLAAVLLVLAAPPAFDKLPPPFGIPPSGMPAQQQTLAALASAGVVAGLFLINFTLHGVMYVYRWTRMRHALVGLWIGTAMGAPLALLLARVCEAAGAPLDVVTLAVATLNLVAPGVLLAQLSTAEERFAWPGRRLYAALLAILTAWMLAAVPYQALITILGVFAMLDVLLVALPCCSPVQRLRAIDIARQRAGEAQMPGFTFQDTGRDGLFLGFGDFIVFSAFAVHATHAGVAALAAVSVGVVFGLVITMTHVALKWPLGSLEPAIPLSAVLGFAALVAERFIVRGCAAAVAAASAAL